MKTKVIATIIALGMVAGAFAMMAAPVKAADPMTWHFYDTTSWADVRLRDTTSDGTNVNGAVARWVVVDTPAEVPTDVTPESGSPFPTMATWIGAEGRGGTDYYGYVQTNAAQTNPTLGEPIRFFMEKDPNVLTTPHVYNPTSAAAPVGGTVPHGYIWAAADTFRSGDAEPLPSGSPPTTFFEVLEMPAPTYAAGAFSWAGVTGPADVAGGAGGTNACIVSWQLYESVGDNNGPWTQVGTANFGNTIAYVQVPANFYSVGVTFTANVKSTVLSMPLGGGPPPNVNAVVTGFAAETGNLLVGNHNDQQVVLRATVSDAANEGNNLVSAQVNIDGAGWQAMTAVDGAFDEVTEDVTYTFTHGTGYYATGVHNYQVRGDDGLGGALTPSADSFTIVDTTVPSGTYTSAPTAIYTTQPASFIIGYEDFTAINLAVTDSYITWQVNGGGYTNYALVNDTFVWGTYSNILTYSIPGGTFVDGDTIDYNVRLEDSNNNFVLLGAGSFTVSDAPPGVQDPYPIYGYVQLYNGVGGVYTPITSTGGQLVTATWISSFDGSTLTGTDTVNALGQFSIDCLNYTDGQPVMVTATFEAPYNNNGYNYTTFDIVGFPGGRQQNVLCGIPYEVVITAPLPAAVEMPGTPFPATYVIYDIDGVVAQGYYSFADGPMIWTSQDPLAVLPAANTFDGVADAGTATAPITLFMGGNVWINISETTCDFYPTPWDNFQIMTAFGVFANGWYDDYDNITVFVSTGGFSWNVVVGWNMVSVPQDVVEKGTGTFDAYDALNFYCDWQLPGFTELSLADRIPGNPSTYNVFDYGMAEILAFPMDGVHAYWVYCDVAGIVQFNATNYTTVGSNVVNAGVGWNLLGFTHNYSVWATIPTASMWADGTVSATLLGADKVVVTQWLTATQWYHSYVDISTFPGMATHNWAWDFSYAAQPGNGYFLWLDAAAVITFDVEF